MFESLKTKGAKLVQDLKSISENRRVLQYGLPIVALLILINMIQVARFNSVIAPLTHYSEGLVDDVGGFRKDIANFGNDLNEMRSFLLLPTKDYSFTEKETEELADDQKASSKAEQAIYFYLEKFVNDQKTTKAIAHTRSLTTTLPKNTSLINGLKEQELIIGKLNGAEPTLSFKIGTQTENYFEVLGDLTTGSLSLRDALGGSVFLTGADEAAVVKEILAHVKTSKGTIDSVRQTAAKNKLLIAEALKNADLVKLLESKKLAFPDNPETLGDGSIYTLQNQDGAPVLTVTVDQQDGAIRINEEEVQDSDRFADLLIAAISQVDGKTATEKKVLQVKVELENILKEPAFSELLKEGGLKVNVEPREAYNQLLYDVTNVEGKVEFSFVIELSSGNLKVLKNDRETDLMSVLEENAKKKL